MSQARRILDSNSTSPTSATLPTRTCRLPSEILRSVFSYCEHDTLKQLCLVNRQWRQLILPFLFSRITIPCHLYYLERLIDDLSKSDLKHRITCVTLDLHAAVNVAWMIWDSYRVNGFLYARAIDPTESHPMKVRYIQPRRNTEIQEREINALATIFDMLYRVDCVVLDLGDNDDPARPDCWAEDRRFESLLLKLKNPGWCPVYYLDRQNWHWERPALLESVVIVLARLIGRLAKLSIRDFNLLRVREGRCWTAGREDTLELLLQVIRSVDRFSIEFLFQEIGISRDEGRELRTTGVLRDEEIGQLIRHASNVTELEIICQDWMDGCEPYDAHSSAFDIEAWNHLSQFRLNRQLIRVPAFPRVKKLTLYRMRFRTEDLLDFLTVHCPRLVDLRMEKITLAITPETDLGLDHFMTFFKKLKSGTHILDIEFVTLYIQSEDDGAWISSFRYVTWSYGMSSLQISELEFRKEVLKWFLDKEMTNEDFPVYKIAR